MSNAQEALKLIEKCIAMKEDRILRSSNNDPVGYFSICAAYGLLETHLGTKAPEAAKAAAAERFIGLHYKLLAYQKPPFAGSDVDAAAAQQMAAPDLVNRAKVSRVWRPPSPFHALWWIATTSTWISWLTN